MKKSKKKEEKVVQQESASASSGTAATKTSDPFGLTSLDAWLMDEVSECNSIALFESLQASTPPRTTQSISRWVLALLQAILRDF